MTNPVKMT